jgi:hypothetical protein
MLLYHTFTTENLGTGALAAAVYAGLAAGAARFLAHESLPGDKHPQVFIAIIGHPMAKRVILVRLQ